MHVKSKVSRTVVLAALALPLLLRCGFALAADLPAAAPEAPARPSHPGGTGPAVGLAGNADSGAALFATSCAVCHGPDGKGGVPNPGSADGTVPALNPIDPTIAGAGAADFVANADLFLEHGSRPEGPAPEKQMPAWGDTKALQPQQIADLIAYLLRLNQAAAPASP
jgi:mono/diheme cytochrome c family protein